MTGIAAGPSTRYMPGVASASAATSPVEASGGRVYDFAKLGRTAFLQMGGWMGDGMGEQMGAIGGSRKAERAPPAKPPLATVGLEATDAAIRE